MLYAENQILLLNGSDTIIGHGSYLVYIIIIALKDFCLYTIATTPNDWERLYDLLSNNLIFSITQYTKEQHRWHSYTNEGFFVSYNYVHL